MARIQWDEQGERIFEAGVDRGVLYLSDGYGVPWNGLVSVIESFSGDSVVPRFHDGDTYYNTPTIGDYASVLSAYTYPEEFLEYEGFSEISQGLYVDDQTPKTFGLTYRTHIGNDIEGVDYGYKIHIVYNLTASASSKSYATNANPMDPTLFAWDLAGVPEDLEGYRPTAHVTLDSRFLHRYHLPEIEEMLYGTETTAPRLPSLFELSTIIEAWRLIIYIDHGDGTWSATGPDEFFSTLSGDPTTFQITEATAEYIDTDTYVITI